MKGIVRTLLVEPLTELRAVLERLLGEVESIRLLGAVSSYDGLVGTLQRHGPELLVLGLDADAERALGLIRTLGVSHPAMAVLPVSCARDGDTILRAIRAGAREFLALPTTAVEIRAAVERLVVSEAGGGGGTRRCIAVVGALGGVGCTTIAVNLAATLALESPEETALVDLDLLLGAVDVCLDLSVDQSLADIARIGDRLDPMLLKRSLTRHASGLYVLPGPPCLDEALGIDAEALGRILDQVVTVFPVVFLDLSKAFQAADGLALERADTILLVVQLEPVCLRNSARLLDLFRKHDGLADKVRVVANRVGASAFEIGLKKAQELLKQPIEWQVADAARIVDAARSRGVPLETEAPGSRPHRSIQEIARALFPDLEAGGRRPSRFGRIAASFF